MKLELGDWEKVKTEVVEKNILQKTTVASRIRQFNELRKRLDTLGSEQLEYLSTATLDEARSIAFIACSKLYRFIREFSMEVVREKYLIFDYQIEPSDFTGFVESKAASSKSLGKSSEATIAKLRQVMYRMFAEVGLVESTKHLYITKPLLPETVIRLFIKDDSIALKALLLNDDEIAHYVGAKR